jgi:hypothetical protein
MEEIPIACFITDTHQTLRVSDWVTKIKQLCGDDRLGWRFHKGRIAVICHDKSNVKKIRGIIDTLRSECPGMITWE